MDQLPPRSTSRHILVILCVAVVGTAILLVAINALMNQPGGNAVFKDRYSDGFKDGFNAAREQMRIVAGSDVPEDVTSFNGEVVRVGQDRIVVKQTSLDTNPIADGVEDERTVTLNEDAKVYLQTRKDADAFDREMEAFMEANGPDSDQEPPSPATRKEMKLSEIQAGARVLVESASPVRLASDIVATTVVVLE